MPTGRTSFTASNIQDGFGNKLATGTLSILPTDAEDNPITATSGESGGGAIAVVPACVAVTTGAIPDSLTVADTRYTSPANICYRITVKNAAGLPIFVLPLVQSPGDGSAIDLDTYSPQIPTYTQVVGLAGVDGTSLTPRGPYSSGTTYNLGDIASESGSSFISLQAGNAGHDPSSSPTWWMTLADSTADDLVFYTGTKTITYRGNVVGTANGFWIDPDGNVPAYFDAVTGAFTVNCLRNLSQETLPLANADLIVYLVIGQSLAIGYGLIADGLISTTSRFNNKMLNGGVRAGQAEGSAVLSSAMTSLVPLTATSDATGVSGDTYWFGETIANGFADTLAQQSVMKNGLTPEIVMLVSGVGATVYTGLKKGTTCYANSIAMVTAVQAIATAAGKTLAVGGLILLHGEADQAAGTTVATMAADILQWRQDYESDILPITGQSAGIPMLISQVSTTPNNIATAQRIPDAHLLACAQAPGKVFCFGPKYQLSYADNYHPHAAEYTRLGELLGRAEFARLSGKPYALNPLGATIIGSKVYVQVAVPVAPLLRDVTLVTAPGTAPGAPNDGSTPFEGWQFSDGTGSPPLISSWSIVDAVNGLIEIQLSAVPTGSTPTVYYAETGNDPALYFNGGSPYGQRGNLRDSSAYPSLFGFANNYNWCSIFTLPCGK